MTGVEEAPKEELLVISCSKQVLGNKTYKVLCFSGENDERHTSKYLQSSVVRLDSLFGYEVASIFVYTPSFYLGYQISICFLQAIV